MVLLRLAGRLSLLYLGDMSDPNQEALALTAWKAVYRGEPAGEDPLSVVKVCLAAGMDINARAWTDGRTDRSRRCPSTPREDRA